MSLEQQHLDVILPTTKDGKLKTLARIEAEFIAIVVKRSRSKTAAAEKLGIGRSTLYRKLDEQL